MINWFKNLFRKNAKQEPLLLTNPVKYEDEVKVTERPPEPTPTKPAVNKKSTTETKPGRKKTGVTKTDIQQMNKVQLESYAKKEFGVDIDRRRKKVDLVIEVLKLAKK